MTNNEQLPIIEVDARNARITIPITMSEELVDEKISLFYKDKNTIKSPIPGSTIVDISKISIEKDGDIHYGMKIIVINIQNIMIKHNKTPKDEFYLKLKNKDGGNDDKCIITNTKVPYFFKYSNSCLNVYDIIENK